MNYLEYPPLKALKKYINCFWVIRSDGKQSVQNQWDRTLPDGSLELVFHLKDAMIRKSLCGQSIKESENILIGQVTKPYLFSSTGDIHMIGVRFFPYSAHYFFDIPINEVNDRSQDLELIWNDRCRKLRNQIEEAGDSQQAIRMLESFLLEKVRDKSRDNKDRYLTYACRSILANQGNTPINDISSDIGITNRYLEKIFRSKMGISPKFFSRIIRFQYTLKHLSAHLSGSLTEAAYMSGYFDQSHFIRDFKKFTGLTPQKFIEERHPMSGHFINPENSSYLYNF